MSIKQKFDLITTRTKAENPTAAIPTWLRWCASRASDHRLARRRHAFKKHPLKAPRQTTLAPGEVYARVMSAADCEREARDAELAAQFAAAAAWWTAATAAETASLTKAVEAGQWPSQAAHERYVAVGNRRVDAYTRHRREAKETADTITRQQAGNGPHAPRT